MPESAQTREKGANVMTDAKPTTDTPDALPEGYTIERNGHGAHRVKLSVDGMSAIIPPKLNGRKYWVDYEEACEFARDHHAYNAWHKVTE